MKATRFKTVITAFLLWLLCVVLSLAVGSNSLLSFLFFLVASGAFLVGFFGCFDHSIRGRALLSLFYLMFVAQIDFWAGAVTLNNEFGGTALPFLPALPIFRLTDAILSRVDAAGVAANSTLYWIVEHRFEVAAIAVMAASLIAIIGVVGMARGRTACYVLLLLMIAVLTVSSLYDPIMRAYDSVRRLPLPQRDFFAAPIWWQLLWPFSCGVALWLAWRYQRSEALRA